jgi:hypothetical protein
MQPSPATKNDGAVDEAITLYLRTGDYDASFRAWPGNVIARETRGHAELLQALISQVSELSAKSTIRPISLPEDLVAFTRRKVAPMVRGLFRRDEVEAVLAMLEKSVLFLTPDNIVQVLQDCTWLHTAWHLANIYLGSIDAQLLGDEAPQLVGFSEETTCFVSLAYFEPGDPFADFLVHEAAHVFHNCKRPTVGLPETRTREWLLDIDYPKRETFAYSCEAYARILELAPTFSARAALAAEYATKVRISEERVDVAEVGEIVVAAASARNGWKVILERCAPERRPPQRR